MSAAFALAMLSFAFLLSTKAPAQENLQDLFVLQRIYRIEFTENPPSGVKRVYRGFAAALDASEKVDLSRPDTKNILEKVAQDVFESRLRRMTEDEGGDIVWITFFFKEGKIIDGKFANRTYRVIRVRSDGKWDTPSH